jgi:ADP-heptose:LPS heptosyltransferase
MKNIPFKEAVRISIVNLLKELIKFTYFLIWLLFDPRKFTKINVKNVKNVLVICGGAIGDIYNILGVINAVIKKYPVNIHILTLEKNRKFVKNPLIDSINLENAKKLIDKKIIDSAVLIDPSREKEIFDKEMFFKLFKVPYVVSSDSFKLNFSSVKKQSFPISATRKMYPVGANGPQTFLRLFGFLKLKIDKPLFYFTDAGKEFSNQFFKENLKKSERVIVIHPSSPRIIKALDEGKPPAHLWPIENWARLIDEIAKDKNIKMIMTGIKSESPLLNKIYNLVEDKSRIVYSVGKIPDLESLASVVRKAIATVTLDTSMAHITSQVETPAVIIYGATSPKRVRPIGTKNIDIYHKDKSHECKKYACKFCHNIHMKSITVDEVYSALKSLVETNKSNQLKDEVY